ncbi:MAG: hypothetical protein ACJASR_000129 [Psychroserpens sp.]|jgi:hypothetical protein
MEQKIEKKRVIAFSYYRETLIKKIFINFFGKDHKEQDEVFTFEGKLYNNLFYYLKQYPNKD